MAKTLILGNNPEKWWIKEIPATAVMSVPNISIDKVAYFINKLPKDLECIVIDADSLTSDNNELCLDIALYIRLMLHDCRQTALSGIIIVSELNTESFKGYGAKSMVLMTQGVSLVNSETVTDAIDNATPLTPGEYVEGFLNLIKIVPQDKLEGRHSIANEWGADALFNVVSSGVKSNIIPVRASSSLYFKYSNVVALDANYVKMIINGRTTQYLANKITVPDKVKYILIDDEAEKGWSKVLATILPNATQEVWDQPVSSYEELASEVKKKIASGDYDLIFLDLRMSGVSEEGVVNPDDFSGMKILKAIKKINKGIQVIMLTATNKAWNLKALIDAGADGYYMKESPEYHFNFKYSEQNAYALVDAIKKCLKNSYLQEIVAQQQTLELPTDSEMSDNIYNQLSIALSLILKAKSKSEYAFAYISLEQVFEIASAFLICQKTHGDATTFYFTEDTREQCRLYENGIPQGYLTSSQRNGSVALWRKIASIYFQLYGGTDKEFGEKVRVLINMRNEYIHPNNGIKPDITRNNIIDLFNTIMDFLSVFK